MAAVIYIPVVNEEDKMHEISMLLMMDQIRSPNKLFCMGIPAESVFIIFHTISYPSNLRYMESKFFRFEGSTSNFNYT